MKAILAEAKEIVVILWGTLKELADSKKAILVALASILSLLVVAVPSLKPYQDVIYSRVDIFLGILVILIGLIDTFKAKNGYAG